jgi:hypothetical protein
MNVQYKQSLPGDIYPVETARFVVQEHTTPEGVHWDLMLEQGGALLTFRLPAPPTEAASAPIAATRIHDHPLRFLTYEGPVQNNTGRVRIADGGALQVESGTEARIVFALQGRTLQGSFTLARVEGARWTLTPQVTRS